MGHEERGRPVMLTGSSRCEATLPIIRARRWPTSPRVLARFARFDLRGRWLELLARVRVASLARRGVAWCEGGNERASLSRCVMCVSGEPGSYNRSIWEMMVSQLLGDDAYLSLPKHSTHNRARIGCLDRSTGAVYNVARCGRYVWGRNRVFGQSRYVTCKTRR